MPGKRVAKKHVAANLKAQIFEYIAKNKIATIAVSFRNRPWAATVFFAYDQNLALYFMSDIQTRKAKNILQNPKVAVAINEDWGGKGVVRGLQIEGKARMVAKKETEEAYFLFARRHPWVKSFIHSEKDLHSEVQTNRLFKIIPQKIVYQDDELFGPGGKEELVFK